MNEARQWFVEVSPPSADEEGGEHAILSPSGVRLVSLAKTSAAPSMDDLVEIAVLGESSIATSPLHLLRTSSELGCWPDAAPPKHV